MNIRRACVIGHPVAYSRSPAIHKYWLTEHGIAGDYLREDVAPEKIDAFLADFSKSGYVGANVTLPHKEAAFHAVAKADPVARVLGAVNTLWVEDGRLVGANTDTHGFLANFDDRLPGWEERTRSAVVLGAGGAARAILHGLLERGVDRIALVNRTQARAEALARHFGACVQPKGFAHLADALRDADLLVNATSLGMKGAPALDLDVRALKAGAAVYDIVYVPLETPLLKAARALSHPVVDGLGMLLHQAVPAFERFFGMRPRVTEGLRKAVLADLSVAERAS
jgi:shikimate dehydrogenase